MSRAVHQFLSLLRDNEPNDLIDDAWENLSVHDRLEAIAIADEAELEMMEGPEHDCSEENALLSMA